jgi:2-dehydro-3-deoxygalactonokinase
MSDAKLIAVDWGTSNFRAFLLDDRAGIVQTRQADQGIMRVEPGGFSAAFHEMAGDWLKAWPHIPVIMAGMIGCEQGWSLAAHLELPSDLDSLSSAMHPVEVSKGRIGYIVPGLTTRALGGVPDIIRGEETQVAGVIGRLPEGASLLCLPGTHSKWLSIKDGIIQNFHTNMTGEALAVMSQHSILGRLMEPGPDDDARAFEQGLKRSQEPGGLLHHLFGVRTQGYYRNIPGDGLKAYLTGILNGHEIQGMLQMIPEPGKVWIIGGEGIAKSYALALAHFGLDSEMVDGNAAFVRGLWNLARAGGLI